MVPTLQLTVSDYTIVSQVRTYQIPFKTFSVTSASNGGLIEWENSTFS